jgi:hypothetical protein
MEVRLLSPAPDVPNKRLIRTNFEWNSRLAYAIGLIATDGNLSKDKRHVSLTSTDKDLLATFRDCLGKQNSISKNPRGSISLKQSYRVQFGDVVLYDWLVKIGLHENKSLTIGPLRIDKKYFRDFLRGHLDGDGSIIHYTDRYNTPINPKYIYERLFVYFISASEKHLLWLRKIIIKLKNIHGSINKRIPKNKNYSPIFVLKFSTKEAKILLNWIYYKSNLPCLIRKYKIAKPFLAKAI